MFGDSLAFTAGWALATNNAQIPYDVDFHSEGLLGCGVMIVSDQILDGVENPANGPCSASTPVPSSGRPCGPVSSMPSTPTWSWCWPAVGRSPTR